jgi:dTDP-4-amino-4,6-dideoxygalactose transaminase
VTPSRIPYVDLVAQNAPLAGELAAAAARVVAHGQMILGPEVAELEAALAARLGVPEVVAVSNGTDALVLALRLHGIGPGDEVITVAHSFLATANAIALVGARPVFADVDDTTMCMDPAAAARAVTSRTRAIIPVHLNGYPCDPAPIAQLAGAHGLAVVEDAAQALGSRRDGRAAGTASGLGAFSLHPLKVLGALGDAGFLTAGDAATAARLRQARNHGLVDRDRAESVGPNARLDTIQAAFLLVKLARLDGWLAARRAHAAAYRAALAGVVRLPPELPPGDGNALNEQAFVIRHPERDRLREALAARGIDAKIHYPIGIHQQATYRGAATAALPVTERVLAEILSLPVSPELAVADRERVIAAVKEAA